jgi:hypothetical protein
MPRVKVSIWLHSWLRVDDGLYSTDEADTDLEVETPDSPINVQKIPPRERGSMPAWTKLSITKDQPDTEDQDVQIKLKSKQVDQLLNRTNHLIRCYRAITRDEKFTELSRERASPFSFRVLSGDKDRRTWEKELRYEDISLPLPSLPVHAITERIRDMLSSGEEPEVADLFLLDAEQAIREGRFREAVLLCWSTIDSTFNRKYDNFINEKLDGEWAEARDFFKGVDFGLKKKMSAALFLVSGRSLFREPGDLWQRLSKSYNKRNAIIHRGEGAGEDDARLALNVARDVVAMMNTVS